MRARDVAFWRKGDTGSGWSPKRRDRRCPWRTSEDGPAPAPSLRFGERLRGPRTLRLAREREAHDSGVGRRGYLAGRRRAGRGSLPRPGRWSWALPTPARPSAEGCQARPAGRLNAPRGRPLATFLAPGNQQATRSQTPLARKRRRSDRPRLRPIFGSRRPLERAGETPARAAAKDPAGGANRCRETRKKRLHKPFTPLCHRCLYKQRRDPPHEVVGVRTRLPAKPVPA